MSENTLIVYYSWSGNTRSVGEAIHKRTGGTIIEITPQVPYSENYSEVVNQAKKEIRNDFKPVIRPVIKNMETYRKIFIGSPNWWNTVAPPISTFLSEFDFSGKQIFPFCTHGGGGQGRIVQTISKLCPKSNISNCWEIYGNGVNGNLASLEAWLKNVLKISMQ